MVDALFLSQRGKSIETDSASLLWAEVGGGQLFYEDPIQPSSHPSIQLDTPRSLHPVLPSSLSGSEQLLDEVARHAVQEEAQHDEQQQGQHDLDDQPLVAVAHQVADGFQRAEEPEEGGVWATAGRGCGI